MIPKSFIQDLLHRVDIVDVIDRHVKLKKAGANYAACCPFHSEKSPSFTVSQTKQFYHCFGCGAHGTAVGFLMEYSGLGFVEAIKDLAQGAGMTVPEERNEERGEPSWRTRTESEDGENLNQLMLTAAQFYRSTLKDAPQAIAYLKKRGLSGDIAKKFGVGYAPEGWQNLERAFPNYQSSALTAVGLVKQNDEGRRYDIFRDRIMFPIVDVRGNVIGFGGRVLENGEPKYLNSPETPLFEKGRELYGLYQARRAIRDAGRVIVVEGYMDVVALAQHGVEYAVATLGTATTPTHVQKLLRQTDEIVYCFDGDNAGRRAAWRALENSLGQLADGKEVRFLFLPQGEDPDSYVRQHGKDQFEKLLDEAVPLSKFMLNELSSHVDRHTHEGRAKLLQEAKPLVKQITAPMLSLMLRKQLAEITGITQQELDSEFQIKAIPASAPARRATPARASKVRNALELLLVDPALKGLADRAQLAHAEFAESADQQELRALDKLLETLEAHPHMSSVGEFFRGTEFEALFDAVETGGLRWQALGFNAEELQAEFEGAWRGLLREQGLAAQAAKSKNSSWSPEDIEEIRLLKQVDIATRPK
ncbi:MAG: DNA primase [Burkholderiales bacterium]